MKKIQINILSATALIIAVASTSFAQNDPTNDSWEDNNPFNPTTTDIVTPSNESGWQGNVGIGFNNPWVKLQVEIPNELNTPVARFGDDADRSFEFHPMVINGGLGWRTHMNDMVITWQDRLEGENRNVESGLVVTSGQWSGFRLGRSYGMSIGMDEDGRPNLSSSDPGKFNPIGILDVYTGSNGVTEGVRSYAMYDTDEECVRVYSGGMYETAGEGEERSFEYKTNFVVYGNGLVRAREVKVDLDTWCDYVFEENYNLMSLHSLENYIKENGHLPEIPTTEEVTSEGISLGEMDALLLKKVEELTLYVIEQNKKIEEQERLIKTLME